MGDVVPPTGAGAPTLHRLRVDGKTLKVSIYETEKAHTIFIGGHHKFCIDCMIEKGSDVAFLSHIYSNIQCSLEQNFRGGHDTKMILNVLLSFIKREFPHINAVEFNDTSNKTCDNGYITELYEMTYIYSGQTWYQKNFGAQLRPADAAKFVKDEQQFQAVKRRLSWPEFKMYLRGTLPIQEELLVALYEEAPTWQAFFAAILAEVGIGRFCEFVAPWLHTFMLRHMRFNFSFVYYFIPLADFIPVNYEVHPYQRGTGRRYTAKRIPLRRP